MAVRDDVLEQLRAGASAWNAWRDRPDTSPDLSGLDFHNDVFPPTSRQEMPPHYHGLDLSGLRCYGATLRNVTFERCDFSRANLRRADLCFAEFYRCEFSAASLRFARIGSARFTDCQFRGADLAYCSAEDTDFTGSEFIDASMKYMLLTGVRFRDARLHRVQVYGTSAWNLDLAGSEQRDLIIEPGLTVDDIELAQFIHILMRNERVRNVIETVASKVVLILGRFTTERHAALLRMKSALREAGFVPVLFDFQVPSNRNLTETVTTIAHISRFILADLTSPRSAPNELQAIIPRLPSVPVQPLIEVSEEPYGMFGDFYSYRHVLDLLQYTEATVVDVTHDAVTACNRYLETTKLVR